MVKLKGTFDAITAVCYAAFMTYIPDPANYVMKGNSQPKPIVVDDNAITLETISILQTLDKEALISLIQLVSGAIWGYALMDDEQKAQAARLKLYNMGMRATEVHKVVPALDKWFDRTQGKAPQSIALDVKDTRMDRLPIDKLLRLASMLDDPVIISPMPKAENL